MAKTKLVTLAAAEKLAREIKEHHNEIVRLRALVLPTMRKTLKEHNKELSRSKVDYRVSWMAGKARRGYFGTDMKSEQMLDHIQALRAEVKKL